ncbi:MAG: hypothetical protein KAR54_01235 [Candidatus Pacebacteria bacterium]|nr:hypothetical protein [Candidatus Paceibacterota bacterium]
MNKDGKIDKTTATFMVIIAFLIDGIQGFLTLILIGPFVNWLISIFAWLTFFLWFAIKGVRFSKDTKSLLMFTGGGLMEVIPLIASLPGWTITIISLVTRNKNF